jgi:hypothetical protein
VLIGNMYMGVLGEALKCVKNLQSFFFFLIGI